MPTRGLYARLETRDPAWVRVGVPPRAIRSQTAPRAWPEGACALLRLNVNPALQLLTLPAPRARV